MLAMRIFTKKRIREFYESVPEAKSPLDDWHQKLRKLKCLNLAQLRQTFPHADSVGKCTVFNVGGNKYRLITKINYAYQAVYIRDILLHSEYDKNKWKANCN